MNILRKADEIVNDRREEKDRMYGPFSEGMQICADIAGLMRNKKFDAEDAYAMLIALKFSREHFNHKEDNLLDAVAYIGAWNNYIEEKNAEGNPRLNKDEASDFKYETTNDLQE